MPLNIYHASKIKIFASPQNFLNLKFPLTLGFSSRETGIISIDQETLTGFIYIAGAMTATELLVFNATKSVFTALFDGLDYLWIKRIEDPTVDTIEYSTIQQ